jgi:hypothetical protein
MYVITFRSYIFLFQNNGNVLKWQNERILKGFPTIPPRSPQIPNMGAAIYAVACEQQCIHMPAPETGRSL